MENKLSGTQLYRQDFTKSYRQQKASQYFSRFLFRRSQCPAFELDTKSGEICLVGDPSHSEEPLRGLVRLLAEGKAPLGAVETMWYSNIKKSLRDIIECPADPGVTSGDITVSKTWSLPLRSLQTAAGDRQNRPIGCFIYLKRRYSMDKKKRERKQALNHIPQIHSSVSWLFHFLR